MVVDTCLQQSFHVCGMHGFATFVASIILEEGQLRSATGIIVLHKAISVWMLAACFS
jgi:hypothetical protein